MNQGEDGRFMKGNSAAAKTSLSTSTRACVGMFQDGWRIQQDVYVYIYQRFTR